MSGNQKGRPRSARRARRHLQSANRQADRRVLVSDDGKFRSPGSIRVLTWSGSNRSTTEMSRAFSVWTWASTSISARSSTTNSWRCQGPAARTTSKSRSCRNDRRTRCRFARHAALCAVVLSAAFPSAARAQGSISVRLRPIGARGRSAEAQYRCRWLRSGCPAGRTDAQYRHGIGSLRVVRLEHAGRRRPPEVRHALASIFHAASRSKAACSFSGRSCRAA